MCGPRGTCGPRWTTRTRRTRHFRKGPVTLWNRHERSFQKRVVHVVQAYRTYHGFWEEGQPPSDLKEASLDELGGAAYRAPQVLLPDGVDLVDRHDDPHTLVGLARLVPQA